MWDRTPHTEVGACKAIHLYFLVMACAHLYRMGTVEAGRPHFELD